MQLTRSPLETLLSARLLTFKMNEKGLCMGSRMHSCLCPHPLFSAVSCHHILASQPIFNQFNWFFSLHSTRHPSLGRLPAAWHIIRCFLENKIIDLSDCLLLSWKNQSQLYRCGEIPMVGSWASLSGSFTKLQERPRYFGISSTFIVFNGKPAKWNSRSVRLHGLSPHTIKAGADWDTLI